jgi:hypothetical protein
MTSDGINKKGGDGMSDDIWSKTPPTESGWYWVRGFGYETPVEVCRNNRGHYMQYDGELIDCDDLGPQYGGRDPCYEFGPLIPSAEELTCNAHQELVDAVQQLLHRFGHLGTDPGKRDAIQQAEAVLAKLPPQPKIW